MQCFRIFLNIVEILPVSMRDFAIVTALCCNKRKDSRLQTAIRIPAKEDIYFYSRRKARQTTGTLKATFEAYKVQKVITLAMNLLQDRVNVALHTGVNI